MDKPFRITTPETFEQDIVALVEVLAAGFNEHPQIVCNQFNHLLDTLAVRGTFGQDAKNDPRGQRRG